MKYSEIQRGAYYWVSTSGMNGERFGLCYSKACHRPNCVVMQFGASGPFDVIGARRVERLATVTEVTERFGPPNDPVAEAIDKAIRGG